MSDQTRQVPIRSSSTTFATWEVDGHCGDCHQRQLETVRTRDYDRLFRLPVARRTTHSPAHLPVEDVGRSLYRTSTPAAAEPVYLAFRPTCLQQNTALHHGASQRCLSRDGTLLTTRRSVTRRPNGTLKPGSDETTRTLERRLLNSSLHIRGTCPLMNRHTVCSTNTCSRRRQTSTLAGRM